MSGFLASIDNLPDAIRACEYGADIVDLKDPSRGALGGLSTDDIHTIVDHLWEKSTISATVGDLDADISTILNQIGAIADTGVDYVKVGMFSKEHIATCLPTFEYHARRGIKIIAVLFADTEFDMKTTIEACKKARLFGVMLDTAGKKTGNLLSYKSLKELRQFVILARQHGLLTGLAGSLRKEDIKPLLNLQADYLGFRTALCKNLNRTEGICTSNMLTIRDLIPAQPIGRVQQA